MVDVTLDTGSKIDSGGEMADQVAIGQVRQGPAVVRVIRGFVYRHAWVLVLSSLIGLYLFTNLALPKIPIEILTPFVRT